MYPLRNYKAEIMQKVAMYGYRDLDEFPVCHRSLNIIKIYWRYTKD